MFLTIDSGSSPHQFPQSPFSVWNLIKVVLGNNEATPPSPAHPAQLSHPSDVNNSDSQFAPLQDILTFDAFNQTLLIYMRLLISL